MKLKQIILLTGLAATGATVSAQDLPNSFNYQAIINAEDGSPVSKKDITVEVSILQGTDCDQGTSCPVLWQELHTPTTNEFGLFNIEIGSTSAKNTHQGSVATYSDINWLDVSDGYYYMQVRVDFGESAYLNGMTDLGTTKFSAVPYSLVALQTDLSERTKTIVRDENGKVDLKIGELNDVDVSAATENQVLTFDGTNWIPKTVSSSGGTQVSKLSELTGDVTITSPAENQQLVYNGTKWINKTVSASSTATALNDLSDVSAMAPTANQVLAYNGTSWQNMDYKLEYLSDVNESASKQAGYVLTYQASGKWAPAAVAAKLTDLSDINLSTLSDGQVLTYSSSTKNWINKTISSSGSLWTATSDGKGIYTKTNVGINSAAPSALLDIATTVDGTTRFYTEGRNLYLTSGSISMGGGTIHGTESSSAIAGVGGTAGQSCIAIGSEGKEAIANGVSSIAFGPGTTVSNSYSAAIGANLTTKHDCSFVCGRYNATSENAIFTVGYGSNGDPSNLFLVDTDGNATLKGTLDQSSDSRLKTKIYTMNNCLDDVLKLRGVNFHWDKTKNPSASDKLQYGFIAQEIEKVFPDLVSEDASGYKTVNYIGVIPVLTNAIQEQQDEIKELKEENEELKSNLEELMKRVEALEKK